MQVESVQKLKGLLSYRAISLSFRMSIASKTNAHNLASYIYKNEKTQVCETTAVQALP